MDFSESQNTELKCIVNDSLKKEIIAFANTNGGEIYIGVEDDGAVCGVGNFDEVCQQASNMIRDAVRPDISMFTSYEKIIADNKEILKITVLEGSGKPYYLASKGLRSEGVFVRQGTTSVPASIEQIRKMIKESDGNVFELTRSLEQNLSFDSATAEFKKRGLEFGDAQKKTLQLKNKDGLYTNLALVLSEQCVHTVKVAVFKGLEQDVFSDRKEFAGSIFAQMNDLFNYIDLHNETRAQIKGLYRDDSKNYPEDALREAMLNMFVHRDYSFGASSFVKIFSDRIEFVSIGGLLPGIKLEDVELGLSVCRNKNLADIFYRLKLIEAYGIGLGKIKNSYANCAEKPKLEVTENAFKVTLPNMNYNADKIAAEAETAESVDGKENIFNEEISSSGEKILKLVAENGSIKRAQAQELLGVSLSSATRILNALVESGRLYVAGHGPSTEYRPK